jgi:hypothetical protein
VLWRSAERDAAWTEIDESMHQFEGPTGSWYRKLI